MIQQGPSSCLLRHGSAFSKVFAISSATLVRRAVDCSLPLSLLLKGARGTGKFTIASWVAQRLGMHLLEVVLTGIQKLFSDDHLGELL
jgi:peroxin-6